mmetsp:Transcript_17579/g.56770  ORF Transcript_17579/g.56770 Transcript_17579/m.56770 type:complete len:209 (+) Transcript_17579:2611-3237(+)
MEEREHKGLVQGHLGGGHARGPRDAGAQALRYGHRRPDAVLVEAVAAPRAREPHAALALHRGQRRLRLHGGEGEDGVLQGEALEHVTLLGRMDGVEGHEGGGAVGGEVLQAVAPVGHAHGGGLRARLPWALQAVPAHPRALVLRHEAWVGVQEHVVGGVGDLGEQLLLRAAGRGPQELEGDVRVRGEHDVVELSPGPRGGVHRHPAPG